MKNDVKELLLKCVTKRNSLGISKNLKEQSKSNTDVIDKNILLFDEIISCLESSIGKPDPKSTSKLHLDGVRFSLPSNYEVRKSSNGDTCIMTRKYNARVATFVKGSKKDAEIIGNLLDGNET